MFLTTILPVMIIVLNLIGLICFLVLFGTAYWKEKGRLVAIALRTRFYKVCCGCLAKETAMNDSEENQTQDYTNVENANEGSRGYGYSTIELNPRAEYNELL